MSKKVVGKIQPTRAIHTTPKVALALACDRLEAENTRLVEVVTIFLMLWESGQWPGEHEKKMAEEALAGVVDRQFTDRIGDKQ